MLTYKIIYRYKNIILPRSHVCFELEYYAEAYQDATKALGKYISCTTYIK